MSTILCTIVYPIHLDHGVRREGCSYHHTSSYMISFWPITICVLTFPSSLLSSVFAIRKLGIVGSTPLKNSLIYWFYCRLTFQRFGTRSSAEGNCLYSHIERHSPGLSRDPRRTKPTGVVTNNDNKHNVLGYLVTTEKNVTKNERGIHFWV